LGGTGGADGGKVGGDVFKLKSSLNERNLYFLSEFSLDIFILP